MFWKFIFAILPLLLFFSTTSFASFCGKSGVPYSLEVLSNGAPVLGCAQPSCVISAVDADGEFQEDSQFLTDAGGQSDGFFRDGDRALKRYRHSTAPKLIANCSGQFNELSCPRRNQWVGGIEYIDHPRQPLILQCCNFEGLRFSQEVGSTTIGPGEAITGGEVVRGGRQISFDVIANVKKVVKAENNSGNKISYEVTVRRMNCLPDPPEPEVELDSSVPAEVAKILSNAKNKELTDKFRDAGKQAPKKHRADKQNKAPKQQAAPTQEELPEISGGEGDRPGTARKLLKQQKQSNGNNEAAIQPTPRQEGNQVQIQQQPAIAQQQQQQQVPPQQQPQFIPQQQQQQFGQQPDQFPQQQQFVGGQGGGGGQFPTLNPPNANGQHEFQQQQIGPIQQQQQQPALPQAGEAAFQQGADLAPSSSSTGHPLFGLMSFPTHSFPTLPPHTFPTLPPHTFPTLPPHHHTFPTLPPHTFPSFAPHTFPTFAGLFGTTPTPITFIGSGSESPSAAAAFAAPSVSAQGGPLPLGGGQSSSSSFQSASQFGGQQPTINNPHSPFYRRENNALPTGHSAPPRMAPAMGTILAAMQGERYPVMHPILGLIGYSNSAPSGKKK